MKKAVVNISLSIAFISLISCGDSGKNTSETLQDSVAVPETANDVKNIVLYNIPSPIETFTILKMSGPSFDKALLNPTENKNKYTSNYTKALNLGVYSTDLSFCFLYKQNQDFNTYLKSVNELTTSLGIDGSYGADISKRLQANSNNMDSLMSIATEASVNADQYLKENQRTNTTALIATGSWIEAMHIITNIANKKENSAIRSLVAEQKIAARNLVKMLGQFNSDEEIGGLLKDIQDISSIYDNLKPLQGNSLVGEDKMLKSIGNNTSYDVSKEELKSILDKVEILRTKITN
jgi:hypothetical protein